MRMCKWNKFRSNNSTTIPLQSADTRERILLVALRSPGPKRRSSLYRDLGWLMDSAPFCCRVLPQIYSVLLPFWYINFYSIWFAAIAMVIGKIERGTHTQLRFSRNLSLSVFLSFILTYSSSLFSSSFPRSASILFSFSAIGVYSKRTFRGFRSFQIRHYGSVGLPEETTFIMRIKIVQIYELMFFVNGSFSDHFLILTLVIWRKV